MILAKARVIEGSNGSIKVGLSFPTGFDPEEVVQDSVRANGTIPPAAVRFDPRRGSFSDLYREFEVSFPSDAFSSASAEGGSVLITGRFRRGLRFTATIAAQGPPGPPTP